MATCNGHREVNKFSALRDQIAQQCGVGVDSIQDAYPCTPFQSRSILAATEIPGLFLMHFTFSIDDQSKEYLELLKSTLAGIYKRNPTLRTRIVQVDDGSSSKRLLQAVVDEELEWIEVSDVVAWKIHMRDHPINFGQRLAFFVLSEAHDRVLWTMHHTIYDAYSVSLLWSDLQTLFDAKGDIMCLKARPPFNRFVAWLAEPAAQEDLEFWKSELQGYQGPVQRQLTGGRKWPVTNYRTEGKMQVTWPPNTDISPPSLLRFAWACSLMTYYSTSDILFLSVASGRNIPVKDAGEIMGPTVCGVPFRVHLRPGCAVGELLREIHVRSFAVLQHEHRATQVLDELVDPNQRPRHFCNILDGSQAKPIFSGSLPGLTRIPESDVRPVNMVDFGVAVRVYETEIGWTAFGDTHQFASEELELILTNFQKFLTKCLLADKSTLVEDFLDM